MTLEGSIFRRGSTTYYWSSRFFPPAVREDVFKLYSFVRVVDDLVDTVPQDLATFTAVSDAWKEKQLIGEGGVPDVVLGNIFDLVKRYNLPPHWIDAFLASMQWDAEGRRYQTMAESLEYVYGSAEVIGLLMARILDLPEASLAGAKMQGRAMQWINFCRDVQEDVELGRCYFPAEEMKQYGLPDLRAETARKRADDFVRFMRFQLDRYDGWQSQADAAQRYIPKRLRVPVRTASTLYNWTAEQIRSDPFVVYDRKIKPSKQRVLMTALRVGAHG